MMKGGSNNSSSPQEEPAIFCQVRRLLNELPAQHWIGDHDHTPHDRGGGVSFNPTSEEEIEALADVIAATAMLRNRIMRYVLDTEAYRDTICSAWNSASGHYIPANESEFAEFVRAARALREQVIADGMQLGFSRDLVICALHEVLHSLWG